MVIGLELFRERFRSFQGSFVLIGGTACDDWFGRQRLPFRATKELDIVLLAGAEDSESRSSRGRSNGLVKKVWWRVAGSACYGSVAGSELP